MKTMKTAVLLMSLAAGMAMTASASLVVLSNDFTSGTTGGWVTNGSGVSLSVAPDAGIGGGNAMTFVNVSASRGLSKAFSQAVTLGAGDFISLTMDYRLTFITNVNASLSFRFLDSTDASYSGLSINPGSTNANTSWFIRNGDAEGGKWANTFTNDLTAETMTLMVERTITDALKYTASWVGGPTFTKTSAVITNPSDFTFDSLQVYFQGIKSPGFLIDNVVVTTSIPEPATIGMLGLGALITMLARRMRG